MKPSSAFRRIEPPARLPGHVPIEVYTRQTDLMFRDGFIIGFVIGAIVTIGGAALFIKLFL